MIIHTVVFKLKHPSGSAEEQAFFEAARQLARIPGVQKFTCLKQISAKNKFDFGLSMEFDSQTQYNEYSAHPDHTRFIQQYWIKDVTDFMEIDYEPL